MAQLTTRYANEMLERLIAGMAQEDANRMALIAEATRKQFTSYLIHEEEEITDP